MFRFRDHNRADLLPTRLILIILFSLVIVSGGCSGSCSDEDKALIHELIRESHKAGFTGDYTSPRFIQLMQQVQQLPSSCQQYSEDLAAQMKNINDANELRDRIDNLPR